MDTVGRLRYAEHRSIPEIHRELTRRGIVVAPRTVTNLLDRYDELRALATADPQRLGPLLRPQGRVILAIDGLQPDVGHEVLWVLRDCLSGEILLARSLLSSTAKDLAGLIDQVRRALPVPINSALLRRPGRASAKGPWPAPSKVSRINSAISTTPARRPSDLRGGSPRQEGVEEAGAGYPEDRACRRGADGGRGGRRGGGGGAGLLRRGARRLDR